MPFFCLVKDTRRAFVSPTPSLHYGKAGFFFCYEVYNLGLPATLLDSQSIEMCFFSAAIEKQWEGSAAVLLGPDAQGYARPAIVAESSGTQAMPCYWKEILPIETIAIDQNEAEIQTIEKEWDESSLA